MEPSITADIAIFGTKAALACAALAGTLTTYVKAKGVQAEAQAKMVADLIQLRKTADEDLRAMSDRYAILFEKRNEEEVVLRTRIISLEAKLGSVEKFMPDMLKLAAKVDRRIEEVRSQVKHLAPGVDRVEVKPGKKDPG